MIIIKRTQCTYYIKDQSVTMLYNSQYTSYNVYQLQNRKKFKDFRQALLDSSSKEYDNVNDIVGLASHFGLIGMAGYKPVLSDEDIIKS